MKSITAILIAGAYALNAQTLKTADAWRTDPALRGASYGYCITEASTGRVISQVNGDVELVPASILKLVTTSAALSLLGPDYRYVTRISHTGNFDRQTGVIDGDLIIEGAGDPTIAADTNDRTASKWAAALREHGIKRIRGRVVGDASAFKRVVPDHWIWCDVGNYFGSPACALNYGGNKFALLYDTGPAGTQGTITSIEPPSLSSQLNVRSEVIASGTQDNAYIYGSPFSYDREVRGTLPPGKKSFRVEGSHPDPALYCAAELSSALAAASVVVTGSPVSRYEAIPAEARSTLYEHLSPTLARIVYRTNQKSDNLYAEALYATLAGKSGLTGAEAVKSFLLRKTLDTASVFMADACGLSRANTVTPRLMASMLSAISGDSAIFKVINESLLPSGARGAGDRVRLKSGYILRARSYAGFARTKDGKLLSFCVIMNNYHCSPREARLKLEEFLSELAGM